MVNLFNIIFGQIFIKSTDKQTGWPIELIYEKEKDEILLLFSNFISNFQHTLYQKKTHILVKLWENKTKNRKLQQNIQKESATSTGETGVGVPWKTLF